MLSIIAVIAAFGSAVSLVSGVIAVYDFLRIISFHLAHETYW